jgi:hypothetical protein
MKLKIAGKSISQVEVLNILKTWILAISASERIPSFLCSKMQIYRLF